MNSKTSHMTLLSHVPSTHSVLPMGGKGDISSFSILCFFGQFFKNRDFSSFYQILRWKKGENLQFERKQSESIRCINRPRGWFKPKGV